jgi:DNA polymerase (family X)
MDKKDVAHLLEQIAAFLELKGENPFRIRAYHTAARAVSQFQDDLQSAVSSGALAEVSGIGPTTLEIVREALETGRARVLEELRGEVPPGLVEMMKISGLGVAKIRQIHDSLNITTLAELEQAAADGRLAKLPRFGPKTAEKILKGVQFLKEVSEYKLFHHARTEAANLARALSELPDVDRVEVAGSVRRRRELIRDLDFVVGVHTAGSWLADRLGSLVGVTEFVGAAPGMFTLRFTSDTVADIYTSPPERFGFDLVRATGCREHVEALAARAASLGYQWSDEGLKRDGAVLPCPTEETVYQFLDLAFVPPELREAREEIEAAARGTLPTLVTTDDIRGFLHCHSNYSDGTSTILDWAQAAHAAGYEYVGVTDHSAAAMYAGGLYAESVGRQHEEIDDVNQQLRGITVLKGVEVDILETGDLDYDEATRATFDFIIASVHNRFGQSADQMTARILKAMDDPQMSILGHPTGRLLLSRGPYAMDLDAVFDKAAECGVAIEINADPQRMDLDWRVVRRAADRGVCISIGADAHNTSGMGNMEVGVGIARKGWLTADQVLNTRSLSGFLQHVQQRRAYL